MNGLRSYLLLYRWLQTTVSLKGSSAALMWRLERELAQKSPFWNCDGVKFPGFKLKEEPYMQA